ncbi:unnamed protein product [Sphagnum jensenii]|uniref:HMA domain-containing protein n=1 Tax=Sphagnum jensenii TaxID=128206 RepID=A0ABP0XIT5_9BRYO
MSALSTNSSTIVVLVPFHTANRVSITVEVKTVVLKVVMHCEGCASSVKRAVARIPGVTSYTIDFPAQKVTVIGNVKPDEVLRRVAKTGKHATFWPQEPPVPKEEEQKKEKQENESDAKAADDDTNKEGKNEEKPKEITVMLRVAMHCEACVDTVRRAVVRIPGVISSTVDFMAQKVTVVGNVTREEVFKRVSRTGKQTAFWPEEPKEEKAEKEEKEEKEEEKKEEETKEKTKEEPEKEESKDEKKEDAAAAKEENKDKATTQVEERKEPFLVFEELYPVSFALRPDYTRYYYY